MRSYCINLGLKSSDCCPFKRAMRRDRQRRRDHHLKTEAEAGAMQLQVRDCQRMGSTASSQEEATVDTAYYQLPVVLGHPVCDPLL